MATFLKKRMVRLMMGWAVVFLCLRPVAVRAADRDLVEIKYAITNLIGQVEALQIQLFKLHGSFDAATNSLRNDLAFVQNNLMSVKNAVETPGNDGALAARQVQFAASLRDLSNTVSVLGGMVANLKADAGRADYHGEVERQLAGLTGRMAVLTNALFNAPSAGVDAEARNSLAFIKSSLSSQAGVWPGWMNYVLLGTVVILAWLLGWMFANVRGQLAMTEQRTRETREILMRFGSQMEGRVKSMEGSSVAVQNTAREITDCLERVESAVQAQLESVSRQVNSAQIAELAGGTQRTAEQMSQLRAETAELQKFMGELRQATKHWVADFEKQTSRALGQIQDNAQTFEKLLWPEPFRGEDALASSRERIRLRATAGDKRAIALLLALGRLQLALASREGDFTPVVESLDQLGIMAYEFWKQEPDASVESTFETAQAWGSEINKLLAAQNLPLNIRIIMPRAGFDMATMLSEYSLTGMTTRVKEPLSWAVVSKTAGQQQPKVLVTGKVITE